MGETITTLNIEDIDWLSLGINKMSVNIDAVINDVFEEIESAEAKFPKWPIDPIHAMAILNEEVGELNKAVFQASYNGLSLDDLIAVEEEAIQVAASVLMFLKHADKYEYKPCEQTSL